MKSQVLLLLRRLIYRLLGGWDKIAGRKPEVVILCYHSVADDDWRFGVDFETLKRQIKYLKKCYAPVTLEEIEEFVAGKRVFDSPVFAITFDDGYKDVYDTKDFFQKVGIKPALFVLSQPDERNLHQMDTDRPLMTVKEIKDLKKAGWTIGSHSATHADLTRISRNELKNEVWGSKKELEKIVGQEVRYIAYPRGKYNESVLETVKAAGYQMGLSMDDEVVEKGTDSLTVSRVGVDRTHNSEEFSNLLSPSNIWFRKMVGRLIGKPLI